MPVLITAGLSPEAHRLKRILNIDEVVFSDESPLPEIPGSAGLVISGSSSSFVHEILKACLDRHISRVYPLKMTEIVELSKARALFAEYNVSLIIPSEEWLQTNDQKLRGRADHITVLENGTLIAGDILPENFSINSDTGIFTWATNGQNLEYSLYLVDDAGV